MVRVRFDTYEPDKPDLPPFPPYGKLADARARKKQLIKEGYRVKIRKDSDGAYVLLKKHDQLFHNTSWRDKNG